MIPSVRPEPRHRGTTWRVAALVAAVGIATVILVRPARRATEPAAAIELACAAGLREPVEKVIARYAAEEGVGVGVQFGGSGSLVNQILLRRAGDLLLLADDSGLDALAAAELLGETFPVGEQQAVLIVRDGNPKGVTGVADLLRPEIRTALGNPDQVAIGRVARQALDAAGGWAALEQAVKDRGVFQPTVAEVVTAVALGAVDAGVVWKSNAVDDERLEIVAAAELEAARAPIVLCVLTTAGAPIAALKFARYLTARDRGLEDFAADHYSTIDGDAWADPPELTFYCGSVNRRAVESVVAAFEAREGAKVTTVYNGCGILTGQMRAIAEWQQGRGFPDAYMACDRYYLDDVGSLFQDDVDVSETEVVIAVPKGNPRGIRSIRDLSAPGLRLAIGQPKQCTIGVLTRQLLEAEKMLDSVMPNVVTETCSSALLLPMVTSKAVDAAFVYESDAGQMRDQIDMVRISVAEALAVQPLAIARSSSNKWLARRFMQAVAHARGEFEAAGFRWRMDGDPDRRRKDETPDVPTAGGGP